MIGCPIDVSRDFEFKRAFSVALVSMVLPFSLVRPLAGQEHCSADLLREGGAFGVVGYADRTDRCEGIYAQVVGGTELFVASFTDAFDEFNALARAPLMVNWAAPSDVQPRIRARGIKRDVFYQMDASPEASRSNFVWSTDVLGALNLERDAIGIVGWADYQIGELNQRLYVPLRVSPRTTVPGDGAYELTVYPTKELNEIFVSLGRVDTYGIVREFVRQNQPVRAGFYPAERPIRIVLDDLDAEGFYEVQIRAARPDGILSLDPFWIYHPGT